MRGEPIDFTAKETHFFDHLLPLWRAIPAGQRGTFFVHRRVLEHATAAGLTTSRGLEVSLPTKTSRAVTVCASFGDLNVLARTRRRAVLAEHGAGQSYSSRHSSYVGGTGRARVALFLVPGHAAAARNRRYYPRIPNAVIGSPRVDELAKIPLVSDVTTAAISFHWRALSDAVPEAGTAVDHYLEHLPRVAGELNSAGVHVIAHAHPRILDELQPHYERAGIEVVSSFEKVVARADVYAVDNSSTLFEFAALGRPVVVLNSPRYRRSIEHGLRFWSEADVGMNVEDPLELASTILDALEDPPATKRSREEAIARVYAVVDGTSASRGALAVRSLAEKRCLVCGAGHSVCGNADGTNPVDVPKEDTVNTRGDKKLYENPDSPGSYLKLTDDHARALGILRDAEPGVVAPAPPADETTVDAAGATAPVGAMRPAGPTHRARAKADAAAGDKKVAEADDDVKDKKRPAPTTTRRRRRAPVED